VPTVVGLALSDYLADRPGLVKPYQPKPRPGSGTGAENRAGGEPDTGEQPPGEDLDGEEVDRDDRGRR
jgi:hypothetical protein